MSLTHVNPKIGLAIALIIAIIIIIGLFIILSTSQSGRVIVVPRVNQPSGYDIPYLPAPPIPYSTYDDFPSSNRDDQYLLTPEQDLRSADSQGFGESGSSSYFDDQYSLTPEQDLRSMDSFSP